MLVLALDTTTRAGSIALVDDDRIVDERCGDPSLTHAERLPGDALSLLQAHDIALASIDLFAVASGPGSFTGLRIGIATLQGFAYVNRRPMVGIPALEALGQLAGAGRRVGSLVAVWMDAHRRDVFAALYRIAPAAVFAPERLVEIAAPQVAEPAAALAAWLPAIERDSVVWAGDGATLFSETIARQLPQAPIVPHPMLSGAIGLMAVARARRGETTSPAAIRPFYVRRPDAEIDREKRAGAATNGADAKGSS